MAKFSPFLTRKQKQTNSIRSNWSYVVIWSSMSYAHHFVSPENEHETKRNEKKNLQNLNEKKTFS